MNSSGLTKENLLRSLPVSLSGDPKMTALAEAVAGVLAKRLEEIGRTSVYPHIDRLDEGLLDILARDFKVDWWDSDYTLEEKRRTLMTSWQVHKALGTKGAVVKAITSIYQQALVEEWFEYGGEPYHFRLTVRLSENGWDYGKHLQLIEKLQYYKNLRSHRDAIKYYLPLVTVENSERLWLDSLLIKGRFPLNEQQLGRIRTLFGWAAAQAMSGRAGLIVRLHMESGEILRLGSLLLRGKLPFNEQQLSRTRLLLALSAAHTLTARPGLIFRLDAKNREKPCFPRMLIGPYSVDVMGIEAAFFDGAYAFDGKRSFWYTFKRRPAFYSMGVRAGAGNQERISGGVVLSPKGTAQNPLSGVFRGKYRARDHTVSKLGHTGTAIRAKGRNKNTGTAFLTRDSMWLFDGACTFAGERRFNAEIERSEL